MTSMTLAPPVVRGERYPMSWEEFLVWAPGEGKTEWVDGWGVLYVPTSKAHNRLANLLSRLLSIHVEVFDLGEVFTESVLLRLERRPTGRAGWVGRCPDIFVVGKDDEPRSRERGLDGPLLFAVEFISDDSVDRDLVEKRAEYEAARIPEYVAIDARPDGEVFLFLRLGADGRYADVAPDEYGRYHSTALPGFWIDPAWFKRQPLPIVEDVMIEIAREAYEAWLLARFRARR